MDIYIYIYMSTNDLTKSCSLAARVFLLTWPNHVPSAARRSEPQRETT